MDCFFLCFQDDLVIGKFIFTSLMARKKTLFKKTNGFESAINLPSWLNISLPSELGLDIKPILCYPYSWTPFHILALPSNKAKSSFISSSIHFLSYFGTGSKEHL